MFLSISHATASTIALTYTHNAVITYSLFYVVPYNNLINCYPTRMYTSLV